MGSTTFSTYSYGSNAKEAFIRAVKSAEYEHGHGGYTGTIAEKDTYVTIPLSEHKGKNKERYAEKLIDDEDYRINDKWGPAGAIRVTGKDEQKWKSRFRIQGKRGMQIWLFFGWASE